MSSILNIFFLMFLYCLDIFFLVTTLPTLYFPAYINFYVYIYFYVCVKINKELLVIFFGLFEFWSPFNLHNKIWYSLL